MLRLMSVTHQIVRINNDSANAYEVTDEDDNDDSVSIHNDSDSLHEDNENLLDDPKASNNEVDMIDRISFGLNESDEIGSDIN